MSQETGISSQKINMWLVENKLMYKKEDDWIVTQKGTQKGGVSKKDSTGIYSLA